MLAMAQREGLRVAWADLDGELGKYSMEHGVILLDRSLRHEPALCRAVLAHEVGHHVTRQYAQDQARWEAAARAWALRFLIPDAEAKDAWRRAVEELAERRGVPPAWAAARILEVVM